MVDDEYDQTMRAIVCDGKGGSEVLNVGKRPIPVLDAGGEVLIKVEYSALNRADIMQRKGAYPPPPNVTDVLGLECLGRIVTDGIGDPSVETLSDYRVIALLPGGGYAQYAKVQESHTLRVPEGYESEKAASLMEVWCTAY